MTRRGTKRQYRSSDEIPDDDAIGHATQQHSHSSPASPTLKALRKSRRHSTSRSPRNVVSKATCEQQYDQQQQQHQHQQRTSSSRRVTRTTRRAQQQQQQQQQQQLQLQHHHHHKYTKTPASNPQSFHELVCDETGWSASQLERIGEVVDRLGVVNGTEVARELRRLQVGAFSGSVASRASHYITRAVKSIEQMYRYCNDDNAKGKDSAVDADSLCAFISAERMRVLNGPSEVMIRAEEFRQVWLNGMRALETDALKRREAEEYIGREEIELGMAVLGRRLNTDFADMLRHRVERVQEITKEVARKTESMKMGFCADDDVDINDGGGDIKKKKNNKNADYDDADDKNHINNNDNKSSSNGVDDDDLDVTTVSQEEEEDDEVDEVNEEVVMMKEREKNEKKSKYRKAILELKENIRMREQQAMKYEEEAVMMRMQYNVLQRDKHSRMHQIIKLKYPS